MSDDQVAKFDGKYDVVVYGTVCLDAIWRVERLAPPGGWAPILEEKKMIGGEASNTAVALSRWGLRVALVGNAIGDDEDGRLLRRLFARDAPEIDLRYIRTLPAAHTPYCVCIATPDGNRTMYGTGFDAMQCPTLTPELAQKSRFFTMDPNAWDPGLRAAEAAFAAGMLVTAMDYTRDAGVTGRAAINVTSRDHLGLDRSLDELAQTAAALRDQCGQTVIATCGAEGCFVAERNVAGAAVHFPAYAAPEVVDTTGAGDIFRAGLLFGQVQAWDLPRTVRFAAAAAALNCTAMGGWGGVRSLSETLTFESTGSPPS